MYEYYDILRYLKAVLPHGTALFIERVQNLKFEFPRFNFSRLVCSQDERWISVVIEDIACAIEINQHLAKKAFFELERGLDDKEFQRPSEHKFLKKKTYKHVTKADVEKNSKHKKTEILKKLNV
jgi:hypothetical protein